jgi:hypothetical protein
MNPAPTDSLTQAALTGDSPPIDLRGHSHDDHRTIVPALLETMAACGCWILDQRALSSTQTELRFEIQLRSVFELYSGLMAAGVELSRDSHVRLISLCTLRGHNPRHARRRRVITVRLEVSFLEEHASHPDGIVTGVA